VIRPGQYIIVLASHSGLKYSDSAGALIWGDGSALSAERLLTTSIADVYRVR
jgi:hypothetical protein